MKLVHLLSLSALLLGVSFLAGCDKTVTVTWVNTSPQPRTVDLQGPDIGHEQFVVAANGGKVPVKVKVPKKELPAAYQWSAGDCRGNFIVTAKSPGNLMVDVNASAPATPVQNPGMLNRILHKGARPAPTPAAPPSEATE